MVKNKMLSKIKGDFDINAPKWRLSIYTFYWSWIFLYDQIFGFTSRVKNEDGNIVTKENSNTKIGNRLNSIHKKNAKKLIESKKKFNYDNVLELPYVNVEDFDAKGFNHWKSKIGRPLVIKNYLKNAPILDLMSPEKLINNFGDTEIKCVKILKNPGKVSYIGQNQIAVDTTLDKYLTSDEFKSFYINNFYGIVSEDDFLKSCKGEEINNVMGKPNAFTQWFISRPEGYSGSPLHCAPADNMFLNIKGRKEWFFIDPSYTPIMKPALSKHGVFCVSELEQQSEGDFYLQFIEKYPHMRHVPIYKTVLEEGDLLFNPPWWWHRVTNLSSLTIGCATRYIDEKRSVTNASTLYLGMLIESIKSPKNSVIFKTLRSVKNKKNASEVINSIFTKKAEKV